MSTIGTITIPTNDTNLVFPLRPDYPYGVAQQPQVVTHVFDTVDRKITQRFIIGENTRRFQVSANRLTKNQYQGLIEFYEAIGGQASTFLFDAPLMDGAVERVRVRLVDDKLSIALQSDCLAQGLTITLAEVPATTPAYDISSTVSRFPTSAISSALLEQVQVVFPLIKIVINDCPAVYLSDRRVIVGGITYEPRLVDWMGVGQSIDGASDQASFVFGNADRVFTQLANSLYLVNPRLEFSLFHTATGAKIDLWAGNITDYSGVSSDEFRVEASDGLSEIRNHYPSRKISRTCWKSPGTPNCPFAGTCLRSWETCGAKSSFGGIIANPETVYLGGYAKAQSDNSMNSRSIVDDNLYGKALPQVYMDTMYGHRLINSVDTWDVAEMEVSALVGMIRDENEFLVGLGFFNDGEIGEFGIGHTLNGSVHHRSPTNPNYGLRLGYGYDPVIDRSIDGFDQFTNLSETGATYPKDKRAAGSAFVEIRTKDEEGKQIQRVAEAAIKVYVRLGTKGWMWNAPGDRYYGVLANPIWIAANMILRSKGLHNAPAAQQELLFDIPQLCLDAAFCDGQISKIVKADGDPYPSRKRYTFRGVINQQKPLKDWLKEVLNTCLGGYTFSFGKFRTFLRADSGSKSAFSVGNIISDSLDLAPINPGFNAFQVSFGNGELDFVNDAVKIIAHEHAAMAGTAAAPKYTPSEANVAGIASRDEAAVWAATRLKEELGGATKAEWIAARRLIFRTTLLGLETEAGMVCSLQHPDLINNAGNTHEFRIVRWKLNKDFSIDIEGRSTTDSMFDMLQGPAISDVAPSALPEETTTTYLPSSVTDILALDPTDESLKLIVPVQLKPPSPRGSFSAVTAYIRMPKDAAKAGEGKRYDIDWSQVDENGIYTVNVEVNKPTDAAGKAVIYLVSASQVYANKLDLQNSPHTVEIDVPLATAMGEVTVADVTNLSATASTLPDSVLVTLAGDSPVDDNFAGCDVFLAIPQDTDPDPEHPTAPMQLYPQGWHYGESSTTQTTKPFTANLTLPIPPIEYLESLSTPKITWVVYALSRTWGNDNKLVLLTDVSGTLPANHTPMASVTLDFTSYVSGQKSEDLGSITLSGAPSITAGSAGLDVTQDYVPPYFGVPGALSIGSFEGVTAMVEYSDGKTADCGSHPYTKDWQSNPPGNIETLRVSCPIPTSLPATLHLHMMSYSNNDRQKFKKVMTNGLATVHSEYAIATVTVTSSAETVPTPTISGVEVEYRDIPGSKAKQYHFSISLSGVPTSQTYGGTYFDIQDVASGTWQYKAQGHVAGAGYSPVESGEWWVVQPGESRTYRVKGSAYLSSNPNKRASTNEVTVTVELPLDSVLPQVGVTGFNLSISEYTNGEDGNPSAHLVGSCVMPAGADMISAYICEKPYGYSGTPGLSEFTSLLTATGGTFDSWYRRPKAGCRLFVLLTVSNATSGVWRPVDSSCPIRSVDISPIGVPGAPTGCSVTIFNPHKIDGGEFVDIAVNFTAPVSPDYWYTKIEKVWRLNSNFDPAPGTSFEQNGDFGQVKSFISKDVKLPSKTEYITFRLRPVDWQGKPNDAAVVYVNFVFPASGGLDVSQANPANLHGLEAVNGRLQPRLTDDFIIGADGKITQQALDLAKAYHFGPELAINGGWMEINNVAINKLLAGSALFSGTATFASGSGSVTISGGGVVVASGGSSVNVGSSGVSISGGGSTVSINSSGVVCSQFSTGMMTFTGSIGFFSGGVRTSGWDSQGFYTDKSVTAGGGIYGVRWADISGKPTTTGSVTSVNGQVGEVVISVTGPEGPQGPQGPQGPIGPQGPSGGPTGFKFISDPSELVGLTVAVW